MVSVMEKDDTNYLYIKKLEKEVSGLREINSQFNQFKSDKKEESSLMDDLDQALNGYSNVWFTDQPSLSTNPTNILIE